MTRRTCYVDVLADVVAVRMAVWFRVTIPRRSIVGVAEDHDRVLGWGVHGWRGAWLVDGSSSGLVRLDIDPPARAWTLGFPLRLRLLRLSLDDPNGFRDSLDELDRPAAPGRRAQ